MCAETGVRGLVREVESAASAFGRDSELNTLGLSGLSFTEARLQTSSLLQKEAQRGYEAFFNGVADGAFKRPAQAVQQLLGAEIKEENKKVSGEEQAGKVLGSLVPFVAASFATRRVGTALLGEAANPSIYRVVGEQATAGFLTGSLLNLSELKPGESLLSSRLKEGAISAATFATMAGISSGLERRIPSLGTGLAFELPRKILIGGVSGAAAGVTDIELKTGFKASKEDLLTSALSYAAFGAAFDGGGTLLKHFATKSPPAEIDLPRLLASDPKVTVISSPGGWYDKLSAAIYKAPKDHTIVVTDPKWLNEGKNIIVSARRPDVKILLDSAAQDGGKTELVSASKASKVPSASERLEQPKAAAQTEQPPAEAKSKWDIQRELTASIRAEVESHGENPGMALVSALKRDRLVMVGEYHVMDSEHRNMAARLLPQLKKEGGLTHLAIEHTTPFKGRIYKPDGSVDVNSLPVLLQHYEYIRMLEVAKKEGIQVVPIDGTKADLLSRNKTMAKELQGLLKNPDNNVLFWVGNRHLHMVDATAEGPQVAKILRDRGVPLTTFYGQHDNFFREEPMRNLFTPSAATAVPLDKAPTIRGLSWLHSDQPGYGKNNFSEFDYLIMQPYQRPSHFD